MVLIFLSMQKKEIKHTFKILKEWPNAVKELHLKNIYNPQKGYNLQDKLSSNQSYTQLKVNEGIDKAAQKSRENFFLNGMEFFNHSKVKLTDLFTFQTLRTSG